MIVEFIVYEKLFVKSRWEEKRTVLLWPPKKAGPTDEKINLHACV